MAANTAPGVARLQGELDRIRHDLMPMLLIRNGVFDKTTLVEKYYNHHKLIEQAKTTGWVLVPDLDSLELSWPTHLALQDFGLGVGHPLYREMLKKFHPRLHG